MMKITNPQLVELDREIADFNKLSDRYLSNLVNMYGREIYKTSLDKVLTKAEGIKPETEFDKLVLRNICSNLNLNDLVFDYFTEADFDMSVVEFFDKIAGEGTFDYLEDKVKNIPWEERWEFAEKTQQRAQFRVSPFTKEAQESAQLWIPKIKKDIIEYGIREGYLPEDFDMNVLLLPPKEGEEWSSWNPQTNIFNLGSYGFEFFLKEGKVIANPAVAYNTAFHEVIGHGAHQIHSEQMPLCLRLTEDIGSITPTKSITEGIAINAESQSYGFLKQRLDELRLQNEDVERLVIANKLGQQSRMEHLYFALLKDKEIRESEFDGYNYVLELTGNRVLATNFKDKFKGGFMESWSSFGHTLGPIHYQKMVDAVEEKLGSGVLETKEFRKASLQGVWSWEVYPSAVVHMLKE